MVAQAASRLFPSAIFLAAFSSSVTKLLLGSFPHDQRYTRSGYHVAAGARAIMVIHSTRKTVDKCVDRLVAPQARAPAGALRQSIIVDFVVEPHCAYAADEDKRCGNEALAAGHPVGFRSKEDHPNRQHC